MSLGFVWGCRGVEEAAGRAQWGGCRLLPVHPSFHSAALVSISFLLRVMNVPEGRDELLSEGEWDVGQEAAVGNGYVILGSISPDLPFCHLPLWPQTFRSDGSGPSAGVSTLSSLFAQ